MPRGVLQEAVCHGGSSGSLALPPLSDKLRPYRILDPSCSQSTALRKNDPNSAVSAVTFLHGEVKPASMNSLRVAFAEFLTRGDDLPSEFIPEIQRGGLPSFRGFHEEPREASADNGLHVVIPGTNLQLDLPDLPALPSRPAEMMDGGPTGPDMGSGPDDNPGHVMYWEMDGSGSSQHGSDGHTSSHHEHSSNRQPPAEEHHDSSQKDQHDDNGHQHDDNGQEENAEGPIVIDLSKKDQAGLQPHVIAGGLLALFAQAYLWGNVFVTLFKPQRRPSPPEGDHGQAPDAATGQPGTHAGTSPSVGRDTVPGSGAGGLVSAPSSRDAAASGSDAAAGHGAPAPAHALNRSDPTRLAPGSAAVADAGVVSA